MRFSLASTLRSPTWQKAEAGSAGTQSDSAAKAAGPSPQRLATGMPCRLPLGELSGVLQSECASSHSTRRCLPVARQCRATALMEPVASVWSPPSTIGSCSCCSARSTASCAMWFQARHSARLRTPWVSRAPRGLAGPARLPRSCTARPSRSSAGPSCATRKASGPMAEPRREAPTSVGSPISVARVWLAMVFCAAFSMVRLSGVRLCRLAAPGRTSPWDRRARAPVRSGTAVPRAAPARAWCAGPNSLRARSPRSRTA